jgi:sporulation protein YlmC with PRC-barrel domain
MKLTIEVEQEDLNSLPKILVAIDGKFVGYIEHIVFDADANTIYPNIIIEFPHLLGFSEEHCQNINTWKNILQTNFPWIIVNHV